jgi:hypothetical protein
MSTARVAPLYHVLIMELFPIKNLFEMLSHGIPSFKVPALKEEILFATTHPSVKLDQENFELLLFAALIKLIGRTIQKVL